MSDSSSLEARVDSGFTTAHGAAAVAQQIFRAHADDIDDGESFPLVTKFKRAVQEAGLESTVLSNQIEYAERLATYPGQLLHEEMHKLFHLCEEVLALQSFGYEVGKDILERYVAAISAKLHAEREVASLVAEDLELTASHSFWQRSGISMTD